MKLVWVISETDALVSKLQKEFSKTEKEYLVRHAVKLDQIPPEHKANESIVFIIDSFNTEHLGFEGLRNLRDSGFSGQIYMFGEPAPEKTEEPFNSLKLSGFFPAVERADLSFVAALIHHSIYNDGKINIRLFLDEKSKHSSAKISSTDDLNTLGKNLGVFAKRFGIEEEKVQQTLMGLTMGLVQTKHGEASVSEAFDVFFGTDAKKILLAVPAFSKGNKMEDIRKEFAQALGNFHNTELKTSANFQEFHHLVKASSNLSVLGGLSSQKTEFPDPLYIITRVQFNTDNTSESQGYYFAIQHVIPTEELDANFANMPLVETENVETKEVPHQESTVQAHSEKDLNDILNDPEISGDPVETKGEHVSLAETNKKAEATKSSELQVSKGETVVNMTYLESLKSELQELKDASSMIAADIHRLMKERKEPAIDAELKKQNDELKSENARLLKEVKVLMEKALNKQEESDAEKANEPNDDESGEAA